jgi:hypothetical protein
MKLRIIKLTPEHFVRLLQGKAQVANLPSDLELVDLKLDLLNKQVQALVRSDSFEDVAESAPIPEFTLPSAAPPKPIPQPSPAPLPQSKPSVNKAVQPSRTPLGMENEFTPEQRKLLSFTFTGEVFVVKPVTFLKAEWDDINEVVRSLGGRWVKGDIVSYWEIPAQ